jgi:SAM-dependent methyltransferase
MGYDVGCWQRCDPTENVAWQIRGDLQMMMPEKWAETVAGFGDNPRHWLFYYNYLFRDVSFAGKTVIDIGGGVGRAAYYAAAAGASRVVCIEPEADGSHQNMLQRATEFGERSGLGNLVEFVTKPVQEVDICEQFDIVMLLNSINHLDEEACARLHFDGKAREKYLEALGQVGNLSKTGGQLVLTDCSRNNLFASLGIKNPFAPTITWQIHQIPELWTELFSHQGFAEPTIRWTPDRRSGWFGETFLANKWASYCLQSHFCLTMKKQALA